MLEGPLELQLLLAQVVAADVAVKEKFIYAAGRGLTEVARLLLKAGADKDLKAKSGETALMLACRKGHLEIARLLVEEGAGLDSHEWPDGSHARMLQGVT